MRLTIYGGSFDPFHLGHLRILQAAIAKKLVQQIIVIPLGLAPHKQNVPAAASYRLEMVKRAVRDLPEVSVSDYEIKRSGKRSYTSDTIDHFKQRFARQGQKLHLSLLYGSDVLFTIESWHKPAYIMQEAELLVAVRGNCNLTEIEKQANYLRERYGARITIFNMEPTEISSSQLREYLREDSEKYQSFVPEVVADFLQKHRPYRHLDIVSELSLEQRLYLAKLEQKLRKLMNTKRLLHSLNVMHYALYLAKLHQVTLMPVAVAALVHDCAKQMPLKKQLKLAKRAGATQLLDKNIAHGPAGAYYVKKFWGIRNKQVLDAIFYHTTGKPHMGMLEKIIFLADKLEYGRTYKDLTRLRALAETDLDLAMRECLLEIEEAMKLKHLKIHPLSIVTREYLDKLQ